MKKTFTAAAWQKDIEREAKILGIPSGTAKDIAAKVSSQVEKWVRTRGAITESDLQRVTSEKLKKYNADLAYVYENRGKII